MLAVTKRRAFMNTNIGILLLFAFVLLSCGKSFTPATKSDIEDLSKKAESTELCVNENIVLEFGSVEEFKNNGNGQIGNAIYPKVSVTTLKENRRSSLFQRISEYDFGTIYDFESKAHKKVTVDSLKPTVLGRYPYEKANSKNSNFVKAMCDNTTSVQLHQFTFEKDRKDFISAGFNPVDRDIVYEVWNCTGPCK